VQQHNTRLKYLGLSHNSIGSEGGEALGFALKSSNATLKKLDVSFCRIGAAGAAVLAGALMREASERDERARRIAERKRRAKEEKELAERLAKDGSEVMEKLSKTSASFDGQSDALRAALWARVPS
jgi:Ran GTPase-activating protein (RanGAP) involved in mRNA processing and transport